MKNTIIAITFFILGITIIGIAYAAPVSNIMRSIIPETTNIYDIGTSTAKYNGFFNNLSISGNCTGCAGAFAWTPDTTYGANANSTSTPIWFKSGVYASSTITGTGALTITSTNATSTFSTGGLNIGNWQFVVQQTSGNVGVGTTSPGTVLDVEGAIGTIGRFYDTATNRGYGVPIVYIRTPNDTNNVNTIGMFGVGDNSDTGELGNLLRVTQTGNIGVGTTSPWGLLSVNPNGITGPAFVVGSSTATNFIVTNGGNVGIGTTNPNARLHTQLDTTSTTMFTGGVPNNVQLSIVNGGTGTTGQYSQLAFYTGGNITANGIGAVIQNELLNGSGSGQHRLNFYVNNNSGWTDSSNAIMTLKNGGFVGIGTTTPNWKLQVNGTRPLFVLSDTSAGTNLKHWFMSSQGGNLYFGTTTDAYATSSLSALTISANGAVNVNTAFTLPNSASQGLDTNGQIAIDNTSGQLKWRSNGQTHIITGTSSPAFNIASTTLDALGNSFNRATTTLLVKNSPEAFTLIGFYCKASSTGTALIRFGDGANWTETGDCSSGSFTPTNTNNTFTQWEDFNVQASSTAGVVNRITITTVIKKTAD